MGHKKYILIKAFENQEVGGTIIISENQIEYFVEKGLIEEVIKEKKTKIKTKIKKVQESVGTDSLKENNNI